MNIYEKNGLKIGIDFSKIVAFHFKGNFSSLPNFEYSTSLIIYLSPSAFGQPIELSYLYSTQEGYCEGPIKINEETDKIYKDILKYFSKENV